MINSNNKKESNVLFSKDISSKGLLELYKIYAHYLPGDIAVKVHSGEKGNQNFLRPKFYEDIMEFTNGTIVECNTAYDGVRTNTEDHMKLMEDHGWMMYPVDIMDSVAPDFVLQVPHGKHITQNYVGSNITKYNSMLVIAHFKGHPMGGYGGALKQISIGVASSYGKKYIHGAGDPSQFWDTDPTIFTEAMADAASSVVRYFNGNMVFINVMKNMSVDCDCCAEAEDPCMNDIGILISNDPVAIDQACIDLVLASNDKGKYKLLERINSKNGTHILEAAEALGIGSRSYKLIDIDTL